MEDYIINEDWEKENDIFDSLKYGKDCSGDYCLNCDYFNNCNKTIKYESLID